MVCGAAVSVIKLSVEIIALMDSENRCPWHQEKK
jgi:hypothetical protein